MFLELIEPCSFQAVDGAHSARLGFKMMQEATRDPSIMMDAMKDMQDPESQAEVQRMMQDPSFRKQPIALWSIFWLLP